jgi:hypothetical protein
MSALIDNDVEWSNNIQEKISQVYLQYDSTKILDNILIELIESNNPKRYEYLITLYKLIGKTRDKNNGKGEYNISYMMIWTWYKYFPYLAKAALCMFVIYLSGDSTSINANDASQEAYGSWKDIKYFCKYVLDNGGTMDHALIKFSIDIMNNTLRTDYKIYNSVMDEDRNKKLTLVSKWIPREGSNKFGFLYDALATDYFPEYMTTAKNDASMEKALKKCRAQYRMICSKLNRHIDTVQIKQAGKNWADIDHSNITYNTMTKQRNAFLNQRRIHSESTTSSNMVEVRSNDPDRIQCAENLRNYLKESQNNKNNGNLDTVNNIEIDTTIISYNNLVKILDDNRYLPMEKIIRNSLCADSQ